MRTNKWIWILAAVVLAGILVIASQVGSRKLEITEHFPSEAIQRIDIINDSWDLEVEESADNQIHVDITGRQKDKKKTPVAVTRKANRLIIQQDKQIGGAFSAFTFQKEGTIRVSIPKNTVEEVSVVNNEGDLNFRALAAHELIVQNQAGNVKFNQTEADSANFNLMEGDLTVNNSSFGKMVVAAKGNDLYFKNVTSSIMNVFSNSGEIVLNGMGEKGEKRIETKTGDIQVVYQTAPSSLKVAVENTKGDSTVHLADFLTTKDTDGDVNGTIGGGENSLYVKSYSGSIGVK
ncbi:DUF4097 family beta strand repeat-containing protein [Paenibacillus graminis]|uniref:DUF4097 family beta strand repeat-containing protein n=1 Tax=Paenibacillus graminis TaxID=189425 RepID=UPI002DBF74CF|nr:DUF4097 family beta strand repeat-containing protein [Paenibacillus graminis]MEC0168829.1 DUF4097 family beta strand repeat-containing protein [Paenibacillus graminis]